MVINKIGYTALASLLLVSAPESQQEWRMPDLTKFGAPLSSRQAFEDKLFVSKLYSNSKIQSVAWHLVCDGKESVHPFIVGTITPGSKYIELYIDNKLENGRDGSDGKLDRYRHTLTYDPHEILSIEYTAEYAPRCFENA